MIKNTTCPGKLMAANRGEIAIRIFRAANELGLRTVSIFAEEDRFSIHRFKADEAYQLDSSKGPVGAYLDVEGIVALAKQKGVTMIHPGYGFLSENAAFARACAREGIIFIGPSPELLENMGDKTAARTLAHQFKVPTLPGTDEPITHLDEVLTVAYEIGFPFIIKAAFGDGGRGMRVVEKPSQLPGLLAEAQNEALNAFGNPAVFLERYISRAKHIEVQILGDQHGNVVHLYEYVCSVQRNYQKVAEMAPAMHLDPKVRKELCDAAVALAKGIGYNNAGTVEFLYDMDQNDWFFIEMNPRIQVEHAVTECVTGIDLVRSQILIAQGEPLHGAVMAIPAQKEIPCNDFAIQCPAATEEPQKNNSPDWRQRPVHNDSRFGDSPATKKQLALIEKAGITNIDGLTKYNAALWIDKILESEEAQEAINESEFKAMEKVQANNEAAGLGCNGHKTPSGQYREEIKYILKDNEEIIAKTQEDIEEYPDDKEYVEFLKNSLKEDINNNALDLEMYMQSRIDYWIFVINFSKLNTLEEIGDYYFREEFLDDYMNVHGILSDHLNDLAKKLSKVPPTEFIRATLVRLDKHSETWDDDEPDLLLRELLKAEGNEKE